MENDSPFRPGGTTVLITGATSPPAAIQLDGPKAGDVSILVYNSASVNGFLAYGSDATAVSVSAVVPTSTSSQTIPVPAGAFFTLTMPAGLWYTVVTASGSATVYLTPGNGQ